METFDWLIGGEATPTPRTLTVCAKTFLESNRRTPVFLSFFRFFFLFSYFSSLSLSPLVYIPFNLSICLFIVSSANSLLLSLSHFYFAFSLSLSLSKSNRCVFCAVFNLVLWSCAKSFFSFFPFCATGESEKKEGKKVLTVDKLSH